VPGISTRPGVWEAQTTPGKVRLVDVINPDIVTPYSESFLVPDDDTAETS